MSVLLLSMIPTLAAADLTDDVRATLEDGKAVDVALTQSGTVASGQLGSSVLDECMFHPDLSPTEVLAELGPGVFGPDDTASDAQRWTLIVCPTPVFAGSRYGFWPVGDPIPRSVVVFLGREALARAAVPHLTPRGAPDGVAVAYLTNLPNWWWIDDAAWQVVTAMAELGPPVPASVTAVLTPTESRWQIGSAPAVVCGQGAAWHEGRVDDDPERCGTTLPTISGPDGVSQTVSVVYEVSFRCRPTLLCDQLPPFDPLVVSTTSTVEIIQVRGVLIS